MSRKNESGFTLLEIIIAISITAVMMGILLAALRMGYRSEQKGTERSEVSQRMRVLSYTIGKLIRGAYPYITEDKSHNRILFFNGTADSISFVTTATDEYSSRIADSPGLKWVNITVDSKGLRIRDRIFFMEEEVSSADETMEAVFDSTVRSISFQYLDRGKLDDQEQWVSGWSGEEKNYLPSAVEVRITIEYGGKLFDMPPVIARIKTTGPELPEQKPR